MFMKLIINFAIFTALLATTSMSVQAQTTYTWTAGSSTWSTPGNWSPNTSTTGPTTLDTADLNDTTANRTITYDTSASGTLGALNITQTSAFNNILSLSKSLTVTNAITLGASAGTSEITFGNFTLTDASGITLNSGGNITVTGNGAASIAGALNLAGGTFNYTGTGSSALTITGNLSSNSGVISATGSSLVLKGSTNNVTGLTSSTLNNVTFSGTGGAQSLSTNATLTGTTILKASGGSTGNTETIAATAASGTTINLFNLTNNYLHPQTLQLGANLAVTAVTATATDGDTNGFKIDAAGFALSQSTGFVATTTSALTHSANQAAWTLTDSETGGVFAATSFDLSPTAAGSFTNAGVAVTGDLTLDATGSSGGNNLGNAVGVIANTSTFEYTGTAAVGTPATLTSNRTIGKLKVQNGALQLASNITVGAGDTVTVNSEGTLLLGAGFSLTNTTAPLTVSGAGTFDLEGNNQTTGAVTLGDSTGGGTIQDSGTAATLTAGGSGVTVSNAGNVIGTGVTVSGATGQNASSGLTVNGVIGSDTLASSATLAGTGTTGVVTLAGGNTLSSTGTLTTGGISVTGTGNAIGSGTVSGPITFSGTSALAVNGTSTGSATVSSGATLSGGGAINPANGGVTINSGGTLSSGAAQTSDSTHDTITGSGMTITGSSRSLLTVSGGTTLTFALGAGSTTGLLNYGSPNLNSTYLSLNDTVTDQIFSDTSTSDQIDLLDLTAYQAPGGDTLQLRYQNPYLLIQSGLTTNADFMNIITVNGAGVNGLVEGVSDGLGGVTAFTLAAYYNNGTPLPTNDYPNLQLYLYNGNLEVIPEPATWAMMFAGLATLVFWQRRKYKLNARSI